MELVEEFEKKYSREEEEEVSITNGHLLDL